MPIEPKCFWAAKHLGRKHEGICIVKKRKTTNPKSFPKILHSLQTSAVIGNLKVMRSFDGLIPVHTGILPSTE